MELLKLRANEQCFYPRYLVLGMQPFKRVVMGAFVLHLGLLGSVQTLDGRKRKEILFVELTV
jgi:hypothetical protein